MPKKLTSPHDKRTYRLPKDLLERLEEIAASERRPIGAQLAKFLEDAIRQYDRAKKDEKPGPRTPARPAPQSV